MRKNTTDDDVAAYKAYFVIAPWHQGGMHNGE